MKAQLATLEALILLTVILSFVPFAMHLTENSYSAIAYSSAFLRRSNEIYDVYWILANNATYSSCLLSSNITCFSKLSSLCREVYGLPLAVSFGNVRLGNMTAPLGCFLIDNRTVCIS